MLYPSVAFIALLAIEQWEPLPRHHAVICRSDDSSHGYHNALHNSFFNFNLTLDNAVMGYCATGHKICNAGPMTHNAGLATHSPHTGHTTHDALALGHLQVTRHLSSVQGCHNLICGCHSFKVSSKRDHDVSACADTTTNVSYKSCQCHHMIFLTAKIENHPDVISDPRFDQKQHKHYKCSSLPLVLAINRYIYYLLNGTFDQAYIVNHLISRLLLMLQ